MKSSQEHPGSLSPKLIAGFLRHTFVWALVLSAIVYVLNLINAPQVNWGPGRFTYAWVTNFGLFILFASFAGGVAVQTAWGGQSRRMTSLGGGLVVAVLSFVCLAYLSPLAEHRAHTARGMDMEVYAPFGPETPGGRLAHLRYAREHPTDTRRQSVGAPLLISVSWVEHLLHGLFVLPWLGLIYGVVGHIVAELTHAIRPSRRRHARWVLGVLVPFTFFGPATYIGGYVRARPDVSGAAWAWAMLVAPLLLLLVVWALARGRSQAREDPPREGVDPGG